MSRPRGDRDFTREQFVDALAAAYQALSSRPRGRATEAAIARSIGISRTSLWAYRRAYRMPRVAEQTLNVQTSAVRVTSRA